MSFKVLEGKRVAILTDSGYIPQELDYYKTGFSVLGASVDCLTNLWGEDSRTIVSEVDTPGKQPDSMQVHQDLQDYDPKKRVSSPVLLGRLTRESHNGN